ncbi:IMPACT family protein [Arenibacter echinorum]|uniref:Putative YigZ family protein n=1 Tax=Arenibacter echinorum TaxID=440515 RepID=A0A327QPE6_9FLAO|nr:YigZ family protein [Arenibacter echinorum]RAJ05888.1 putative YigZ family protein [Arenibacter echinorum]
MELDIYKTLKAPSEEILFKERKSKFFGYAYPIQHEDEVKPIIEELRKQHHTANHVCYAWQLGVEDINYRANDDGEPNNSAGMPIYGQIQSFGVTNVLVAVARIFGGTKLGVGGLISAYRTAAQMALDSAEIIKKTLQQRYLLCFEYSEMDKVMRTLKQHQMEIVSQKMEMDCKIEISVRQNDALLTENIFTAMYPVKIKKLDV